MTIGVVVAHADDECLGCGGTVSGMVDAHALILCTSLSSRTYRMGQAQVPYDAVRVDQVRQAARELGLVSVETREFEDNRFDTYPLLGIVKEIEAWLKVIRPDTVFTHHPGDANIDHRIVHEAVLAATRPQPGQVVRRLYAFEVPSSTEWGYGLRPFAPNVYGSLSEDALRKKIEALKCYDTELRTFPHPRSEEAIRVRACYWGSLVGVERAEAFELLRETW